MGMGGNGDLAGPAAGSAESDGDSSSAGGNARDQSLGALCSNTKRCPPTPILEKFQLGHPEHLNDDKEIHPNDHPWRPAHPGRDQPHATG